MYANNLVGDVKANPRDFYRHINSQKKKKKKKKKKDRQYIPPFKKRGGNGVAELDSERTDRGTIYPFNDVFNKIEFSEVPLTRSAPFMDSIVVSTEGVIKLLTGLNPLKKH